MIHVFIPINFFKKCPPVNSYRSSSSTDHITESTFLYSLHPGWRYVAHILELMTLIQHNENSMYAGPTKAIMGRYSTRVRLGNEELNFVEEFRYLEMTADCRKNNDIKKQFRIQNSVCNMLVGKFSLHLRRQKSNFQVILLPTLL